MTSLEKRRALDDFCTHRICDSGCTLFTDEFHCGRGYTFLAKYGDCGYMSDDEINAAYAIAFPESNPSTVIKDSGERRRFYTGAVRDIQEGKGRCDLMPLDVIADHYHTGFGEPGDVTGYIFDDLCMFTETGDIRHLYYALSRKEPFDSSSDMFLEVSKHFEDGAKKYGENNWQKGIPVRCYIDSAVRHYLKWLRGDKDEPHDRAFCWNIICAIWTCKHKPELNDYAVEVED